MRSLATVIFGFCGFITMHPMLALPQSNSNPARTETAVRVPTDVVFGVKISTLGAGIEVGAPIKPRSRVRGGFNLFNYSQHFDSRGTTGQVKVSLRSLEAHYDWFPFGSSFHLSPGLLIYNGNRATGNGSVPGGHRFTVNRTDFLSDPANPASGSGKLEFNKVAPSFLVGWSNILPTRSGRFNIPVELGVAFPGSPRINLNLSGGVCDVNGTNCRIIQSDPLIQSKIQGEERKWHNKLSFLRFYPVVSVGFSYHF